MRAIRNHLGDPGLHLLAIAMLVAYLAFGRGVGSWESAGEAPLPLCEKCHAHYLPGQNCPCARGGHFAHALPRP